MKRASLRSLRFSVTYPSLKKNLRFFSYDYLIKIFVRNCNSRLEGDGIENLQHGLVF